MKYSTSKAKKLNGFTLLEMVIAMGLMAMLIGMIFRVAQTSMMLSQVVIEEQSATMEHNAFFNLLQNHFEQVPGDAVMRLNSSDGKGDRKLFSLIFQNMPMAFSWGDATMTSEAVELVTVEQRDGFINLVLRYYDEKVIEDTTQSVNEDPKPVAEITLLEGLWLCECEVTDGRTLESTIDWHDNSKLPLKVKFFIRFDVNSDIVEQTCWIVPKQNPEIYMRRVIAKNPAGWKSEPKKDPENSHENGVGDEDENSNGGKGTDGREDLGGGRPPERGNLPGVPVVPPSPLGKRRSF